VHDLQRRNAGTRFDPRDVGRRAPIERELPLSQTRGLSRLSQALTDGNRIVDVSGRPAWHDSGKTTGISRRKRDGGATTRHAAVNRELLEIGPGPVGQNERKKHCAEDDGQQSDPRLHGTVLSDSIARTARPGDACCNPRVGRCYLLLRQAQER
jgi:hypothetical protein